MNKTRKRIFDIIQIGKNSDRPSRIFDVFIAAVIIANISVLFLETFQSLSKYFDLFHTIDIVTVSVFIVEYLLRIWTADFLYPEQKRGVAIFRYVTSANGVIELLTILPFFFLSGVVVFRMLRVVRIFHLFRLNSHYDSFSVIRTVLDEKKNQILSSLFIISVVMLAASLLMYNVENHAQPESFDNAFSGIWWAVSTILTIGYGDIYPITVMGKLLGVVIAFLGVFAVALPTGIISAGFVEQYQQFKRFGDYGMEQDIRYIQISLTIRDRWVGRSIRSLGLPRGSMVAAVQRGDQLIIPNGDVVLTPGDVLMIAAEQITKGIPMRIQEIILRKNHPWTGSSIRDLDMSRQSYIIMVKREGTARIPDGEMVLQEGDQIYVLSKEKRKRIED